MRATGDACPGTGGRGTRPVLDLAATLVLLAATLACAAPAEAAEPLPALPEMGRTDEAGLPCFDYGGRTLHNPAYLALAAADPALPARTREAARAACEARLARRGDADLLLYDYPYPYHDRVVPPPFPSAFAQAAWVRACLARAARDPEPAAREALRRAARGFLATKADGGFRDPADGWLEEIPGARILNGHLDGALALFEAAAALADPALREAAHDAARAADRALPEYDTGDWSRYDLDRPPAELLLELRARRAPGDAPLALARVELHHGEAATAFDPTAADAWHGASRLAGGWAGTVEVAGRAARAIADPRFAEPDPADLYDLAHRTLLALAVPPAERGAPLRLRFHLAGGGAEDLAVLARNMQFPEIYRFDPVVAATEAGGAVATVELGGAPAHGNLLARPSGEKYHRRHIELLEALARRPELAATAEGGRFRAAAARFRAYPEIASPRDEPPAAPRLRFARPEELAAADLSGGAWPDPAHAPANLVDGSGDTVLLLRPDELDRTFEIRLARPAGIRGVGVDLYAPDFAPERIALLAGGAECFFFLKHKPARLFANLDPPPLTDRVELRFSGAAPRGPVIVRQVRLLLDPDLPDLIALDATLPAFASVPPSWDDLLALDAALAARFPLGRPAGGTPREIIAAGVAQCADRVALLGATLSLRGVPSRPVNLYNAPERGDGHTAMEIRHRGKWRYLDPSFGWSVPGPDGPRSFAEIRANPALAAAGVAPLRATDPPPAANDPSVRPVPRGVLTSPEFFRAAGPAGPAGPLRPMAFPVAIPADGVAFGAFAARADDRSSRDLDSMFTPGMPSGLAYTGRSLEERSLEFRFPDAAPATWEILLVPAYASDARLELLLDADGGFLDAPPRWRPPFHGFRTDETAVLRGIFRQERPGARLAVRARPAGFPSYLEWDALRILPAP